MSSRDQALSDYVRKRIREWRADGRELQELAARAGIAKSSPSTVLLGTGVAKKTGQGYARAFGFASYKALQEAAYRWWLEQGQGASEAVAAPDEPALAEAIEVVKGTMQATDAQIRTIIADFAAQRFRGRDTMWWISTLGAELQRDRQSTAAEAAKVQETKAAQKRIRQAAHESSKEWGAAETRAGSHTRKPGRRAS